MGQDASFDGRSPHRCDRPEGGSCGMMMTASSATGRPASKRPGRGHGGCCHEVGRVRTPGRRGPRVAASLEQTLPFACGPSLWQVPFDLGAGVPAPLKGVRHPSPVAVTLHPVVRAEVVLMEPLLPEGSSLLTLLDAFPSLAFIADADATVLEVNRAARQWLGDRAGTHLGQTVGDTFHCIFPRDSRGDCGTTDFCPSCLVRRSIEAVLSGQPAPRRVAHMIIGAEGHSEDRWFQVSASPLTLGDRKLVLLVLEDATQLVELRELLPLCPGCGASRESSDPLTQARIFLNKHPDFLRADELCTECRQRPPDGIGPADVATTPA